MNTKTWCLIPDTDGLEVLLVDNVEKLAISYDVNTRKFMILDLSNKPELRIWDSARFDDKEEAKFYIKCVFD